MTNDAPIRALQVGPYRLLHRPGIGRPLLVILPGSVNRTEAWFRPGSHDGRPLALIYEREVDSFEHAADEVVHSLLAATGWRDAADLQILGFSIGGFAAILYGALISTLLPAPEVRVVAFNPLTCVWPPDEAGWREARHERIVAAALKCPVKRENMRRFGDTRPWIRQAVAARGGRFGTVLLYAAGNERDSAQARLLAGVPEVTLAGIPTAQHTFYSLLTTMRGRANSVVRIQDALTRNGRMRPAEALARATELHAALAAAAVEAPDLLCLYAIPPVAVAQPLPATP